LSARKGANSKENHSQDHWYHIRELPFVQGQEGFDLLMVKSQNLEKSLVQESGCLFIESMDIIASMAHKVKAENILYVENFDLSFLEMASLTTSRDIMRQVLVTRYLTQGH
jgi:hypothetical protein